jgi:hypothetical protein
MEIQLKAALLKPFGPEMEVESSAFQPGVRVQPGVRENFLHQSKRSTQNG